jgi:hypothetical protein
MFDFAVVFEKGNVIGGFDAQYPPEFVIDFDGSAAETMFDAGAFEAHRQAATDLLSHLRRDFLAEKTGNGVGFDCDDSWPRQVFINRLQ